MREMVSVSQSQFLTLSKLRRISKMFGIKSEFAQVRNLFRNLGSLYFFSSEDLMDEIVVLKPETFVNSIFDLIRNARAVRTHSHNSVPPSPGSAPPSPSNSQPPSPSLTSVGSYPAVPPPLLSLMEREPQETNAQNMAGVFPHWRLKEVWGMDTSYFSDVLALLERSGVIFNIYAKAPGGTPLLTPLLSFSNPFLTFVCLVGNFPMLARSASHLSYSPSIGYSLIPTHLPPAPRTSDLGSLWHPLPEASLVQYARYNATMQNLLSYLFFLLFFFLYSRKYSFELVPRGIFGTLVARTAQIAKIVRCWENSAIFIPADTPADRYYSCLLFVFFLFFLF